MRGISTATGSRQSVGIEGAHSGILREDWDMTERNWMDEAQAALDRVTDATRAAWDSTASERRRALDSAKRAVDDLAGVIDRAVDAAKEQWSGTRTAGGEGDAPEEAAGSEEE